MKFVIVNKVVFNKGDFVLEREEQILVDIISLVGEFCLELKFFLINLKS